MRNPQSSLEGRLVVDHRFSPGLPEDIARAAGYDPAHTGEGKLLEQATLTCCHCRCAVVKNPLRTRPRENCPSCGNRYLCDPCHARAQHPDYDHTPFEQFVDDTIDAAAHGWAPPPFLGTRSA
jgi:hypothetical protein